MLVIDWSARTSIQQHHLFTWSGFPSDGYYSGYTIDAENEVVLANPYAAITVYSNGQGDFFIMNGVNLS